MAQSVELKNPHLNKMSQDYLYHLALNVPNTKDTRDIQKRFGDVKFICMGGTASRMLELALFLRELLGVKDNSEPEDLCRSGNRYAVYKVGPVLCASHGVGMSTFSVVLHELLKLVRYAKCQDPVFLRIGTCGGVGVPPGTVVVTKEAYNGYLRNEHEIAILGEKVVRPANFTADVVKDLVACGLGDNFKTIEANTMATECFYEGQGRTDGAVCNYSEEDKMQFLRKCHDEKGIRNIEMEATMFSSLTNLCNVKAGDICVTLIDRLKGDQVEISMETKSEYEHRPFIIVGRYIQKILASTT